MTPAELTDLLAAPLAAASWQGISELTPSQLSSILTALASIQPGGHLQTGGSTATPTYALGDGGAITTSGGGGTDSAGKFQVTTGTGGTGLLVTVLFATAFTSAPQVTVYGTDPASAALLPGVQSVSNTGFSVFIAGVAAATTAYNFGFISVGSPT